MSVLWHDLECGAYAGDLATWERFAEAGEGPILDLGCGTGRVALHLARHGHRVVGVDRDEGLVAAFNERAQGLTAAALVSDARDFELDEAFGLVLGPMQFAQLLESSEDRSRFLASVARLLRPGGIAAFAIVERLPAAPDGLPPLPDTREVEGWVYSSLPLEIATDEDRIVLRRLRQVVSPGGELSEELDEVSLTVLSARVLEEEAREAGLRPGAREEISTTKEHVGSTVVVLERGQ